MQWIPRIFIVVLLATLPSLATSASTVTPHVVVIKQMHFDPAQITIKKGDTIVWKNEDIFSHSVIADDGSFDSGLIAPGSSWELTVSRAATITYHCRPHPNMTAGFIVKNGSGEANATVDQSGSLRWSPPRHPEQIHPILVNFTAALLPLAFLSDVLGRLFRRQSLHNAAWWMVLFEAAITPLTVIAGWWWKSQVGHDLPARMITVHQWLGTTAAALFVVLAVWRWRIQRREALPSVSYLALAGVAVLALVYQGSLGGAMLFGK